MYRTRTVEVRGETFHLRELSAGAVDAIDQVEGEYRQALALLALSLTDEGGRPCFAPDALDAGLAHVRELPALLVRDALLPAATALNDGTMDHARGN